MSKEQINRRFAESWTTASEGAIELEKKRFLPGGESNPGLPRDRRRYSPLYYRG